jgi:hypothetical protein
VPPGSSTLTFAGPSIPSTPRNAGMGRIPSTYSLIVAGGLQGRRRVWLRELPGVPEHSAHNLPARTRSAARPAPLTQPLGDSKASTMCRSRACNAGKRQGWVGAVQTTRSSAHEPPACDEARAQIWTQRGLKRNGEEANLTDRVETRWPAHHRDQRLPTPRTATVIMRDRPATILLLRTKPPTVLFTPTMTLPPTSV